MTSDSIVLSRPRWDTVVLVCRACRKRGDGPTGMPAKGVIQGVRRALDDLRPRPRIVQTSCLGLCPKGATAIAAAGRGAPPMIIAVKSLDGVAAAAIALLPATRADD